MQNYNLLEIMGCIFYIILDYITIDNEKSDKRIYLDEYTCEDREIINETINNY